MAVGYNPATPSDGLIFNVNTANPRSYSGGTVWRDLSRYGNNGTLTNGPTLNTGIGGGISFDGSNDYINIEKQLTSTFPFTISVWLKSNGSQNLYTCAISQGHNNQTGFAFQVGFPSATDMQYICGTGGALWTGISFSYTPSTNLNWTNLLVVVTSSNVTTYRDGIQRANTNINSVLGTYNFTIGQDTIQTGRNWNGLLDDLRLYNRALSGDEIAQIFNATRRRFGV